MTTNWNLYYQFWYSQRDPSKEYKTIEEPGLKFELVHIVFEVLQKLVSKYYIVHEDKGNIENYHPEETIVNRGTANDQIQLNYMKI